MDAVTELTALDFDSFGAEFVYIHQNYGAKGLKARLADFVATGLCRREWLQEAAAELAAMGLLKPAKLVAQAARQCLPMTDLHFCLSTREPFAANHQNITCWQRRHEHRAAKTRKRIERLLRQAGLDLGWLDLTYVSSLPVLPKIP